MSPKHLTRYVGEAAFRSNAKGMTTLGRLGGMLRVPTGRMLPYKAFVAPRAPSSITG